MATSEFVSPRDALDIVFAHRNRAYGAYQLRRAYPRYLGRAFAIGLLFISFGFALPQILNALNSRFDEPVYVDMIRELGPPPDIDPELPPPPPPPPPTPPPPERATVRLVPPTPTPDDLVQEEQLRTQQDVLDTDADVGTKDRASEGDAPPSIGEMADFSRVVETAVAEPDDKEYNMGDGLQKPPAFPGGDQDLLKYLAENIKYPLFARENNIDGTVVLSFVVNKDGSVSDVSVLKEIGGGCGKEAVRVVQSMPRWIPGEANGHPVKVRFTLPVRYRLQ